MGNTPRSVFLRKAHNFETPYFFRVKFETPYSFPYEFDTPYFTQKLGLSPFLISEIVTILAIFGSVAFKKMEILKNFWSNFEIYLRPHIFLPENLRPGGYSPLTMSTPSSFIILKLRRNEEHEYEAGCQHSHKPSNAG